jgi:predicted  nucleic acid-binding Zn-ribbon protein
MITNDWQSNCFDSFTCRMCTVFQQTVGLCMPSGGNTTKFHRLLAHCTTVIRQLGGLQHCSSQAFEKRHTSTKQEYEGTTRRAHGGEALKQLVARVVSREEADAAQTAAQERQQQRKHKVFTVHDRVLQFSTPQSVIHGVEVNLEDLEGDQDILMASARSGAIAGDLASTLLGCPLLVRLPQALKHYTVFEGEVVTLTKTALVNAPVS